MNLLLNEKIYFNPPRKGRTLLKFFLNFITFLNGKCMFVKKKSFIKISNSFVLWIQQKNQLKIFKILHEQAALPTDCDRPPNQ